MSFKNRSSEEKAEIERAMRQFKEAVDRLTRLVTGGRSSTAGSPPPRSWLMRCFSKMFDW